MPNSDIEHFEIFPWNKNFETGIELIDEQHKILVDIVNRLASHLAHHSNQVILNEIYDELIDYTDYHFKSEEKIWIKYFKDDEWYLEHEKTHGSFIDKILALKNNQEAKPLDNIIYDIVSFLSKWLAYHILDTDRRMSQVVAGLEAGMSMDKAKAYSNNEMSGAMETLVNTVLSMYDTISVRTLDLMREKALRKRAEQELQLSEDRWKFILDGGSENVWDWDIKEDSIDYKDKDPNIADIIHNKIANISDNSTIHPDDIEDVLNDFKEHLDGKTDFYTNKHRVLRPNGSWSWILSRGKIVKRDEDGNAQRIVGTHTDITERELASLIFENSSQGMFVSDSNNNIISVNKAFTKITGYEEDDVLGKNPKILSSNKHEIDFYEQMWDQLAYKSYWDGEIYNKRKNGEVYPQNMSINSISNENGEIDHYVALFFDISEKKKSEELITKQANFDELTELRNRRLFFKELQKEIKHSSRTDNNFALLFIDLDNFKEVNDSLGHNNGDTLLKEVSNRILKHVRESDIVARFGGDEFTIILPKLDNSVNIDRITKNIIDDISRPFELGINKVYVSASIGITMYPNDAENALELLKNADQAMYQAKKMGRSRSHYFTKSMQESAQKRQELLNDLHSALDNNEFELYYQPIVDVRTNKTTKAEALIRWNHPTKGLISPDDFIPISEQSGLIIDIGDWVFKEAMRQTKIWKDKYDENFKISVNKSPVQFRSTKNLDDWIKHIETVGLSGKNCIIEITENLLMDKEGDVINKLMQLRENGFEISIDDFGTGYSSLSYLKKFDIEYIKIDKSFVDNLTTNLQDVEICRAVTIMAKTLDIEVVAEGIETKEQLDILKSMDLDYAQGYHFSRPVPAEEFEAYLGFTSF